MSHKFILNLFFLCVSIIITYRYSINSPEIKSSLPENADIVVENDSNPNNKTILKFIGGSFYLPKDNEGGEDAHFMCKARNVIGVADGVGGWAAHGIDAGKFARELMENAKSAVLNQNKGSNINPVKVLESAFSKTHSVGSSTALVIALNDNNNVLRFANLGDSGFMLFRKNKLLYRSPLQHHSFNFPYQLGTGSKDTPNLAYRGDIQVEDGDIIVAATDGLFDNVYDYEIERILDRNVDNSPDTLAREIAECALRNALDTNYSSPFAKAAQMEGFRHDIGGKYDDITVVVSKIERA